MRCFLSLLLLALLSTAVAGVSSITVSGSYPGEYPTPGNFLIHCYGTSNRVHLMCIADGNANGQADAGEQVLWSQVVQDNGVGVALPHADYDDAVGAVAFVWQATIPLRGPVVFRAQDDSGAAEQGCTLTTATQAQAVTGTVYDATGAGASGVVVQASHGDAEICQAITGADGSYTLPLPSGISEITVLNRDNVTALCAVPERYRVVVPAGATISGANFSLPAPAACTISGKVYSVAVPLPGCVVSARQGDNWYYAQTDVNGDYTLSVPAGTYYLAATPPSGWEPYSVGSPVTVPPSAVRNITLTEAFTCTHYLIGWVHDGAAGVGGALVEIPNQQRVFADVRGIYEMWVNGRSTLYTLAPSRPGFSALTAERYQGACDTTAADLPMHQNSYVLQGTISEPGLPAGAPATGGLWVTAPAGWSPGYRLAFTDAAGHYSLNLPAATYNLTFSSYGLGGTTSDSVTLPPSTTRSATLPAGAGGPTLSGSVTPTSGLPGTHYTYQVTYTDPYWYRLPDQVCVLIDGRPYEMTEVDPGDTNSEDGKVYTFTYTGPDLSMGAHCFRFVCTTSGAVAPWYSCHSGPLVGDGQPFVVLTPSGGTVRGLAHLAAAVDMGITGDTVTQVDFAVDGATIGSDASAPYTCDWDTWPVSVADGPHTVRATAHRSSGGTCWAEAVLTADNTTFDDVPKTSPQWAYLEAMAREGITSGCQTAPLRYCPGSAVTRGQMAVFICRAAGWSPVTPVTPSFSDVPPGSPQYGYIEAIKAHGVTAGCTPTTYCPNVAVTRGQMAVFLCRAAAIAPYNKPTPTFTDVPKTYSQYTYVEALVQEGITAGCTASPPRYCPTASVTRGQMAVFLCRAFGIPTGP